MGTPHVLFVGKAVRLQARRDAMCQQGRCHLCAIPHEGVGRALARKRVGGAARAEMSGCATGSLCARSPAALPGAAAAPGIGMQFQRQSVAGGWPHVETETAAGPQHARAATVETPIR